VELATLTALNAARAAREPVIVVTDIASGAQRLVRSEDFGADPLADALRDHLARGRSGLIEAAGRTIFLAVHAPVARMVIIGAVHISQHLAALAHMLDYDVVVIDPRSAFASLERFGEVEVIAQWPDAALPGLAIDRYTAFVALTHDPKIDDPALCYALARDCFYIGALGSTKTHAKRALRLKEMGMSEDAIARIHAPIGLRIGALSPAEIAVSIMAEITSALRQPASERGA